jgi:predicted dehydrogenase
MMVGQICRFMPAHIAARQLIAQGDIGRPLQVLVNFLSLTTEEWLPEWHRHQTLAEGGYLLSHNGSHTIDLTLWLLNERPSRVYCEAASNIGVLAGDSEYSLLAWFDSGVMYSETKSINSRAAPRFECSIVGSEGALTITNYANLYLNEQRVDCAPWGAPPLVAPNEADLPMNAFRQWRWAAYKLQLEEFHRAISEGREPSASGASVLPSIEVIDAALRAAQAHQVQSMTYVQV